MKSSLELLDYISRRNFCKLSTESSAENLIKISKKSETWSGTLTAVFLINFSWIHNDGKNEILKNVTKTERVRKSGRLETTVVFS